MANLNWTPVPRPDPVTLRGRYVTLEPLDPARHAQPIFDAVNGHDAVWDWLAKGPFATVEELAAHIEAWQRAKDAVVLAIVPQAGERSSVSAGGNSPVRANAGGDSEPAAAIFDGEAKGWASLMRIEPAHGVIEVGNIVFSPALQRTRAATEAMYLMAHHVFEFLGYRRYEWKCNALNVPSRRAALRFGFTFEGIFRQHMVVRDQSRDSAWFSMLDHEWAARKRAFEAWLEPGNFDGAGRQRQSLQAVRDTQGK